MRGVAHDPVLRAKLMAMHEHGGLPERRPRVLKNDAPAELVHIDFKFLPALRNARHDFEFAAVDDFSREAVVWIATESTSAAATTFLERVAATLPYPIEAVLPARPPALHVCGTKPAVDKFVCIPTMSGRISVPPAWRRLKGVCSISTRRSETSVQV